MNPALLGALLSFAPGLLSSLFGDPARKYRQQVRQLTSAQNVGQTTQGFYQNALSSPAYSQALGTIAAGANQASGNVAQSLAARGIGTSGTGAILSGLTPSLIGSQQAGLRTAAYGSAQDQAMKHIQAQLAALSGTQGPSQTQQFFAGGLDAFIPYLSQLLQGGGRQPLPYYSLGQAAGMGTGAGQIALR